MRKTPVSNFRPSHACAHKQHTPLHVPHPQQEEGKGSRQPTSRMDTEDNASKDSGGAVLLGAGCPSLTSRACGQGYAMDRSHVAQVGQKLVYS